MSFFKRLFSSDHRAALSAEAAGDFELAAERYALAGQRDAAVRMHIARADRAKNRAGEIDALRDALHWAEGDEDSLVVARKALGKALLAQAQAEGVETEKDREKVREAAALLAKAHYYEHAGDAFASIGDDQAAAEAYRSGGLVQKLELTLSREQERRDLARSEQRDFADYDMHMRGGARDEALASLRECLQNAEERSDYRRLVDELESRLITGGRVLLKTRHGRSLTLCSAQELLLGRDSLCDMVLRTGGVSRRHASIFLERDESGLRFELADAGSRNGTRIGGSPIQGRMPLVGSGSFGLGEELEVHYQVSQEPAKIVLSVQSGLDAGTRITAAGTGERMSLAELGVGAELYFKNGRPILQHPGTTLTLNGETLAHGDIQLIHGDAISIEGVELEVA